MSPGKLADRRTVSGTMPKSPDDLLRKMLNERTVNLREIGAKTGIGITTLADFARGHPPGRPKTRSMLRLHQAEALAEYFGYDLVLTRR